MLPVTGLGATFSPGQDPTTKPPVTPVESAVKLLSTALPRTFGAPTPVSPQLLAGFSGVHPDIASAVVRSVLAALGIGRGTSPGLAGSGAPGSESANLAGAVGRGAPALGVPSSGTLFRPPQFTFSNPPPSTAQPVPPPPGNTGTPGPLAPPPIPSFGNIGMGTGDLNPGERRV